MEVRVTTILLCIISLATLSVTVTSQDDQDLLTAQETLMNSGIGIDLEESHIEDVAQHEDLPAAYQRVLESLQAEAQTCVSDEPYRRADGVCNNLQNPLWGAVLHPQHRMLPNAYLDGVHVPRMVGKDNNILASARKVSVNCFPPNKETQEFLEKDVTQMSMQWGQYIDHDVVFTEVMPGSGCCSDPGNTCVHPDAFTGDDSECASGPCFPIEIPEGDRYFNETCMNFKRSFSINVDGVNEQISGVTSFVDASTVYGSNQALQDTLRTKSGGLLKTSDGDTLPNQGPFKCRKDIVDAEHCPHAGDVRVNVFPGLTAVHLLFVREHNRLAKKLEMLNPQWDDEKLFQEARKIVIALHQIITYDEFLPHIIGDAAMDFFKLRSGNFEYDQDVDPGIFNEFAVAGFRYGHSQINALLKTDKTKLISEIYFQPWETQSSEERLKRVLKQQCKLQAQKTNQFFTTEVTDKLFLNVDAPGHSTDLGARNIQRGRDHGVRPYIDYLDLAIHHFIRDAGLTFDNFRLARCLSTNVYSSVDDVDLFVGGLHEKSMPGAQVGPTFAYIIGEQFRSMKYGDRFFYETSDPVVGFTSEQLHEVKKMSFAHVLCRNTDNRFMQRNLFRVIHKTKNPKKSCDKYYDIDLSPWEEE